MVSSTSIISFPKFFEAFVKLARVSIVIKPQHHELAGVLQQAALGQLGKSFVVVNIPPRFGKTKMAEALALWQLAVFPDSHMIYTSYSAALATASVRYIRETLLSDWYRELFPATRLGGLQQADNFNTAAGGVVYGAGTGGSITGFGAGLKRRAGGFIVIDDPSKPDDALSTVLQQSTSFWLENTLKSRRNSPHTPIIVLMQRLAEDDLSGYILANYPNDVHHVKVPALVDGVSIIPETVSTESLRATEKVNPFAFSAQYMQEPILLGGNLFKRDWFRYHTMPEDTKWEEKIITADTAQRTKTHNDSSVLQCWGRLDRKAYLLDQVMGKFTSPELLALAYQFYHKHNIQISPVARFIIESAASGPGLEQSLIVAGIPCESIRAERDKVTRVNDILAFFATGMVFFPKTAPWLPGYEAELLTFRADGNSRHDDQVDATQIGVSMLLGTGLSILDVLGPKRT